MQMHFLLVSYDKGKTYHFNDECIWVMCTFSNINPATSCPNLSVKLKSTCKIYRISSRSITKPVRIIFEKNRISPVPRNSNYCNYHYPSQIETIITVITIGRIITKAPQSRTFKQPNFTSAIKPPSGDIMKTADISNVAKTESYVSEIDRKLKGLRQNLYIDQYKKSREVLRLILCK